MLDGGTEYQRYGGADLDLVDRSGTVYLTDGFDKCRTVPIWGSYGIDGTEPLKFLSVSEMENSHLEAVIKSFGQAMQKWRVDLMTEELKHRNS